MVAAWAVGDAAVGGVGYSAASTYSTERAGGELTVRLNRETVILREKNMEQRNSAQKWAAVKVGEQGQ